MVEARAKRVAAGADPTECMTPINSTVIRQQESTTTSAIE